MRSRKTFLLRISPELYEALEAWAHQELRSVNGQIEYLLKEAVRRRGRAVAPDERADERGPAASQGHDRLPPPVPDDLGP